MAEGVDTNELYRAPAAELTSDAEVSYDDSRWYSPQGRLGRLRYLGYSIVLGFVAMIYISAVTFLSQAVGGGQAVVTGGVVLMYVFLLPISFILMIKRLHDFNRIGWYSITMLVPLVNVAVGFILLLVPGTKGVNDYGAPPRPSRGGAGIVIGMFVLVVVIGLLAAVALPAYQDYVKTANAAHAHQVDQQ